MGMRFLQHLSIKVKITMLLAAPLLLSLWFMGNKLLELYQRAQVNTVLAGELLESTSTLVHLLQVERGMSAGYLGGETTVMPEALVKIRQQNDEATADFLSRLAVVDRDGLSGEALQSFRVVQTELARKKEVRQQIANRSVPVRTAVEFYTNLNTALIQAGLSVAQKIDNPRISQEAVALSLYLRAKDAAGLERAAGAVGFANGWTPADFQVFVATHERFKERLERFLDFATVEDRNAVAALESTPEMKRFEEIRQAVLTGGDLSNLDAETWFSAATDMLKVLRGKESILIQHLEEDMAAYDAQNKLLLTEMAIFAAILLALVLALSLVIARDMTKGLSVLNSALKNLANGDANAEVTGASRRDEIGAVARNVVELRTVTQKKQEEETRADEERREEILSVARRIGAALLDLQNKRLDNPIQEFFPVEFKSIRMDFNDSLKALSEAVSSIGELTSSVDESTKSIAEASMDLAHRTEAESATLEKTTHAMRELTASVQHSAENADRAERLADSAQSGVASCDQVVKNTIVAMDKLQESSQEISQITKVIQDIAFQTNLLALNAGVEAARAGEAGRGFAVVASEVRMLAQRCADAVQQIDELTARSSEQVKNGAALVDQAGQAMSSVNEQVGEISDLVVEIAGNIKEQSVQMGDVNTAVGELEVMAQQNAAMAEQTTAATTSLSEQAQELRELVTQFTVPQASGQLDALPRPSNGAAPHRAIDFDDDQSGYDPGSAAA
ncbi:methyl-accepting chemotaxis protein [Leisingera aquaemixtae]|uniref:methyl-accepting chemotaxis protein n=1 Tax=Leisingera aquaemixtae TaxID=1396826 RepID=UPI0021A8288E|nr:methyl-accepting chemotaxis protein [Leisingera aquaemixtae]UWQ44134.1 methyl-accepting chemotaxis protein [Leisingera aquaemixtae]